MKAGLVASAWLLTKKKEQVVAWSSPVPLLPSLLTKTFLVFGFFLFWFFLSFSLLPPGPPPSLFFLYVIYVQSLQSHMLGAPTALRSRRNWRPATSTSRSRFLSLFSLFL